MAAGSLVGGAQGCSGDGEWVHLIRSLVTGRSQGTEGAWRGERVRERSLQAGVVFLVEGVSHNGGCRCSRRKRVGRRGAVSSGLCGAGENTAGAGP